MAYIDEMKTTIDIPNKALTSLLKHTKARTKREAVVRAIDDFNSRKELEQLVKHLGTFEEFMDKKELDSLREGKSAKAWKEKH